MESTIRRRVALEFRVFHYIKETPEDEHRHTGREYAEKMRIYAEASDVPTVVTPIKKGKAVLHSV